MLRKGVKQYVFCLPVGIRYLISPLPA
jgi:hypothetical protein